VIGLIAVRFGDVMREPVTTISSSPAFGDSFAAAGALSASSAGLFWHQQAAGRYSTVMADKLLVRVLRRAGLKRGTERSAPESTIFDMRLVNRMLAWYRRGKAGCRRREWTAVGVRAPPDEAHDQPPETYVGYRRADNFASSGGFAQDQAHVYSLRPH
jgi:hypothetical protein